MQTGENEQALRKIMDMTRLISLTVLAIHFYYYCYRAFVLWRLTAPLTDRLLSNIQHTGLLENFSRSKWIALGLLIISLMGVRGKKDEKISYRFAAGCLIAGLVWYWGAVSLLYLPLTITTLALLYMATTLLGYLLILSGGVMVSRVIQLGFDHQDIFNRDNETFPQEERLLANEYSVNLPAQYRLKSRLHKSWINIINPFRGLLVLGSPGSGKSWFVIRHVITQHLSKGFAMFVYDFKFDDLSLIAYNHFLKNRSHYLVSPEFYVINFDDLSRSHRCNPLDKENLRDITDAAESARTILIGLNREWIRKQGDFFVESAINFLTAIIWFLRSYLDGAFCSLPHVIELMQVEYDKLFSILRLEKEIEVLINPFINAYLNGVMEQLEGQLAAAKIAMARLSSPQLYYVLSGNDFTLDINNPDASKIVCMGNNPQKIQVYGAVLSLYISRLIKLVNRKGGNKCSLVFDEFPTIYVNHMDSLLATARSNRVATTIGMQDFSQLKKDYGRDQAEVIMNIPGNIISGQVSGDTAKQLSERFGRIMQDRASFSINSNDTSVNRSKQLDSAIPASAIASLSSGEFVGMVADDPEQPIKLKAFHGKIMNDHNSLNLEEKNYQPIPVVRQVTVEMIQRNYSKIRQDVEDLVTAEMERIVSDPTLAWAMVRK